MFTIVLETSGAVLMLITCPFVYSKVKGLVSTAAKCLVRLGETLNESTPGIPLNSSKVTLEICHKSDKNLIQKKSTTITPAEEMN